MRVNLPCLMGSCPNFLRPTCSYTECLPSFLTGSCPMEWTTASYSSCLSFDSYWPYDSARCGFPRTLTLHLSTSHFVMIHIPWIWVIGFLSRTLLNFRCFWSSAGFWNTALFYIFLMQPGFPSWIPAGCLLTSFGDHTWFPSSKS